MSRLINGDLFTIYDMYEYRELLYSGDSLKAAKQAIKDRVYDTSAECDIVIYAPSTVENDLYDYLDEVMDYVNSLL